MAKHEVKAPQNQKHRHKQGSVVARNVMGHGKSAKSCTASGTMGKHQRTGNGEAF